jgi:hypothetical protein
MRALVRTLRAAGLTGVLATIVLCQSVLAHTDGRGPFGGRIERRAEGRRMIHHYELVRVQKVSGDVSEFTYRAWLTNFGSPMTGATATVTSASRGITLVDASLTFGAAATGRTVASADTFSVRYNRRQPFGWWWPGFRWQITAMSGGSPSNRAPVANAGSDRNAPTGARVVLDGRASSDPDRDPIHFNWTLTRPIGSNASLSSPTAATPSFVPDRRGTYEARLIVDDGALPSPPDSVVITVQNSAPVANAGPDQTALVTHLVTLDGSASGDPDGDAVSYQWALTSRPAGSSAVLSDPAAMGPTFLVDRPGSYTARLIVSDGSASSVADTVSVTTVNAVPVANAGPDQTAALSSTVTLNGSASSDADGNALAYVWTLQSVPAGSAATLNGASSVNPSFVVDRPGTYVARLVVNDGQVSSAADTVTISTSNSAPVANAGADQTAVVTQTVTLNGGASSDVDGDALAFVWAFVSRPAGSSAVLSGAGGVRPTFVVDRPGLYQVRLVVNDGALSSASDVVDVQTVNSAPVANAGADQSGYVGQTVTLDGSGSTDVDGNTLGYVWSITSRPARSAAAVSDPVAVAPTFVLDRAGVYVAQLVVNDGTVSSPADTVTITTRNSVPVANAGADRPAVAGRIVTLDGAGSTDADGDLLAYSWALTQRPSGSTATMSGASAVSPSFRADRPGVYIAQLIVNDGSADSAPDTVTITTGNTAPVANAGADQSGLFVSARATVDGSDSADADGHLLSYRWSLLSVPAGSAASLSDPEAVSPWLTLDRAGQYVAQLIVNDGFQDGAPDTVVLTVVNRTPVANAGSGQSVFTGAVAMLTGAASSDADGDVLTYQWSFTSMPAGSSATLSGASSVAPSFTADRVGTYVLSLTVTDPSGASDTDSVTVNAFTPATVTVTASDASASEAGPDAGAFTFTRTGSTAAALLVQYTVGGSATNGTDYTALGGSVTIPAGAASATVTVTPIDDPNAEGAETVAVTVQPDGAYTVGAPSAASVSIADNDRPMVTIVATDASAAEAGPDTGTFTITRTGPTTASLRVTYTANGSAQGGVDYVALDGQVFIPAGSSTVTLTVTPIPDGVSEAREVVNVFLTTNSGLTVGTPGSATVAIAAD